MSADYQPIFTSSGIIIRGLEIRLKNAGIQCIVKDKFESARLAGFGEQMNNVELLVHEDDLDKATPIVDSYKSEIDS